MTEPTPYTTNQPPTQKQRHGCLTAYLVFMIVANSASTLVYLVGSEAVRRNTPNMPAWAFPVLIVLGIFNLVCAIALFRWKKWGFWGFVASAVIAFAVNLSIGIAPGFALVGLLGVAILYGVLHIGKEEKGWPQLD
jgi:hypothetical protein